LQVLPKKSGSDGLLDNPSALSGMRLLWSREGLTMYLIRFFLWMLLLFS